jgi:predicted secreted protein
MVSSAKSGSGVKIRINGDLVAEIVDVTPPKITTKTIDVTNHDSPDSYEEFLAGMMNGGEASFEANWIPDDTTGQRAMITAANARSLDSYTITFPPELATQWDFTGLITSFELTSPRDKAAGFKATIKVSGKPVLTTTASSNLTGLSVSDTTLVPSFSAAKYSYVGVVTPSTASVTVTPTNASASVIKVNGTIVVSGVASGAILTAVGVTQVEVVTQDANEVPVTYTILLSRAS